MYIYRIIKQDLLEWVVSTRDDISTFVTFVVCSLIIWYYLWYSEFSVYFFIILTIALVIFIISNFVEFFHYFQIWSRDVHYFILFLSLLSLTHPENILDPLFIFGLGFIFANIFIYLLTLKYFYKKEAIPLLPIIIPNIVILWILLFI